MHLHYKTIWIYADIVENPTSLKAFLNLFTHKKESELVRERENRDREPEITCYQQLTHSWQRHWKLNHSTRLSLPNCWQRETGLQCKTCLMYNTARGSVKLSLYHFIFNTDYPQSPVCEHKARKSLTFSRVRSPGAKRERGGKRVRMFHPCISAPQRFWRFSSWDQMVCAGSMLDLGIK